VTDRNPDNNQEDDDYSNVVHDTTRAECCTQEHTAKRDGHLPSNWILGDSCSTVNITSNPSLLRSIHKAPKQLRAHCNAGTVNLDMQATFGDYPEPVWHNPKGIANIMSLDNMTKCHRVTVGTWKSEGFTAHLRDGQAIVFAPSAKGLHKHEQDERGNTEMWTMIQTADEKKSLHSKRALE